MLEKVLGAKAGPIRAMLERTHPDLARYVTEFAYGEVYARAGLGLRERELLAVCALTMQNLGPQLKTHVYGALNCGVTRAELEETFLHIALYAGFPAALSGFLTAREVFDEIDAAPRPARAPPARPRCAPARTRPPRAARASSRARSPRQRPPGHGPRSRAGSR